MYISVGFICIVLFKTAVPLLIFYLDDLSIVLKSPSIILLLSISPLRSAIFFLIFRCFDDESIYIYNLYLSVELILFVTVVDLKSISSEII